MKTINSKTERALVMLEREHFEEAKRHGLVMDFEEFVNRFAERGAGAQAPNGRNKADVLERIEDLPCDPFVYVGDAYVCGSADLGGRIVVDYEVDAASGAARVLTTMDDYLPTVKMRLVAADTMPGVATGKADTYVLVVAQRREA